MEIPTKRTPTALAETPRFLLRTLSRNRVSNDLNPLPAGGPTLAKPPAARTVGAR